VKVVKRPPEQYSLPVLWCVTQFAKEERLRRGIGDLAGSRQVRFDSARFEHRAFA